MIIIKKTDVEPSLRLAIIEDCTLCRPMCLQTARWCLEKGSPYNSDDHISMLIDCAAACMDTAHRLMEETGGTLRSCKITSEMCSLTAGTCERFPDVPELAECASACRKLSLALHRFIREETAAGVPDASPRLPGPDPQSS